MLHESDKHRVHLAIDGNALKGTGGGDDPQNHLVHVSDVHTGMVFAPCPRATKNTDVSALKPLLTEVVGNRAPTQPELSCVWAFGAAGRRRCDRYRERPHTQDTGGRSTLF
jgi:hypothetical protein